MKLGSVKRNLEGRPTVAPAASPNGPPPITIWRDLEDADFYMLQEDHRTFRHHHGTIIRGLIGRPLDTKVIILSRHMVRTDPNAESATVRLGDLTYGTLERWSK